jgi:hypothetical protein
MNTTFTKQTLMHAPVYGTKAICQRVTRLVGVVGTKF